MTLSQKVIDLYEKYRPTTYIAIKPTIGSSKELAQAARETLEKLGLDPNLAYPPEEFHVTLAYSQTPSDAETDRPFEKTVAAKLTVDQFNKFLVFKIESDYLHGLHQAFNTALDLNWSYEDFKPHISFAKLDSDNKIPIPLDLTVELPSEAVTFDSIVIEEAK